MKQEQVSRSPRNDLRSPGETGLIWFARIVVAACLGALAGVMVTGCELVVDTSGLMGGDAGDDADAGDAGDASGDACSQ